MNRLTLLLTSILFLTGSINSQVPVKESSITIKVIDGKFFVSGTTDRNTTVIDQLTSKIKSVLPADKTLIDIRSDYGVREFSKGWETDFDKALLTVKSWNSGIFVFQRDRQAEIRTAVDQLLRASYDQYGGQAGQALVPSSPKAVLVYLFATWCGPCRAEIPELNSLYEKYNAKGFEIIAIDTDDEPETVIQKFRNDIRIKFKTGRSSADVQERIIDISRFPAIPQSLLFSNGQLVLISLGGSQKSIETLRAKITQLFE